jgi:hypothetical protein
MPLGSITSYPDPLLFELMVTSMMFNDGEFIITNVARETTIQISFVTPVKRMRPTPPRRKDMPVEVTYTAQNICDKDGFKAFYKLYLGKSVKMDFEGFTYYGYLSKIVTGEFDISFNFTYTSKIEHIEEDPGFFSR